MPTSWKEKTETQRAASRAATQRWRERNKALYRTMAREAWRRKSPEEKTADNTRRRARYHASDPESRRADIQRRYVLVGRQAQRKRNGLPEPTRPAPSHCELCGKPSKKALALDHDHVTGKFRGWLCDTCNRGLGMLGDCLTGVARAAQYLSRAES